MLEKIATWIKEKKDFTGWSNAALAGSIFLLPFDFQIFELALAFALFFRLAAIWEEGKWNFSICELDWLIFFFLFWSFLSVIISKDGSILLFIQNGVIPIFFYLFISRQNMGEENRKFFLQMFWGGAAISSFFGLWEVYSGAGEMRAEWVDITTFSASLRRMAGPLENPNLMAGYLAMTIAFWSSYRLYRPRNRDGIIGFLGIFLLVICLLMTYSRGAWLSLFVILIILGAWARKGKYLFFGVLSLAGLILLTESSVIERMNSILYPLSESSSALRLAIWHSTLYIIGDYPILGIGWGAFPTVYPFYDYFLSEPKPIIYHAHNLYLQLIAETGLVGFVFWTLVVGRCIQKLWERIRTQDPLALAILCALGIMLFGGITDDWLYNPKMACFFWFLIGLSQCKIKKVVLNSRKKIKNYEYKLNNRID